MAAVTRFRVDEAGTAEFERVAAEAIAALRAAVGCRRVSLGRAADDPTLWALVSEWDGAGTYRRALSSYAAKVALMQLGPTVIDEPGAFELIPT